MFENKVVTLHKIVDEMAIDRVCYWKDLADYDLETAEAMFATKRWLYVGFMCHQVLEKTLKAYWRHSQPNDPTYVHNLVRLVNGSGLSELITEEQQLFIDQMTPLNIEARYPEYKEALLSALSESKCREIIDNTKNLKLWIESLL